ncbi:Protein of unknown function [Cotesia congregata]|uniref:Uncharacterized protein n=1 Tax=Cotesia congregata TaxID=51543 RepID=A0A8J2EHV1_COTCN|nr:Protein of unknown function [Cotesia congregata]
MLQPIHHSKRRYWEIGLAAPSLEFKANDGPRKEGRDEECDMCLIFLSSTFSICRVQTQFVGYFFLFLPDFEIYHKEYFCNFLRLKFDHDVVCYMLIIVFNCDCVCQKFITALRR